jgi:hypothetical protein
VGIGAQGARFDQFIAQRLQIIQRAAAQAVLIAQAGAARRTHLGQDRTTP